jgi:monofunctional biosynthetic peptidoglycan transglycosylase
MIIFDFRRPAEGQHWYSINDSVMGGLSTSGLQVEDGRAVFAGFVSLENNGGFASVRTAAGAYDLGAYSGISLRVRGDGKTYKLNLRLDADFDGINYRAVFPTTPDQWLTVRLPFSAFHPHFRGQQLTAVAPLDPHHIVTFGLLIGDRQAGPFRLEIEWIGGYKEIL